MRNATAFLLTASLLITASCSGGPEYRRIEGFAQGGTFHIIYSAPAAGVDEDTVISLVSRRLQDIDFSISGYNKGSLLSRFNRGEDIVPDRYFLELFEMSMKLWKETGGLFDVSGGPLFDFWGFGFKNPSGLDSLRDDARTARIVDSLLEFTGMDLLTLEDGRIIRKDPRVTLNFNAIAQGYSCDLVAEYLHSLGVNQMLVDVGGEIYCEGFNPSGQPWGIGLDRPVDGNDTPGEDLQGIFRAGPEPCGVVTSGNYRKFYVRDGKKYAHTIDPKTGCPVTHSLLCATVIAGNATEADALATYCMVIGFEKARDFILSRPDLEGCLVYDEDGQMKTWTSPALDFLSK